MNSDFEHDIQAKFFKNNDPSNESEFFETTHAIYFHGEVMDFEMDKMPNRIENFTSPKDIHATVTKTYWYGRNNFETNVMKFQCYPYPFKGK